MKKYEKLAYLILNHFDLFTETFLRAFNDLSEKQEVFCCCGRVTSYVHEVHCKKFQAKVENTTIKRLRHLLPKDKNEPGFNVGDWIVDNCGYIWKIERILNQVYILKGTEGDESRPSIDWVDDTFHLYTIQDAKDGDVLATSRGAFIYNGNNGRGSCPGSYCGINTLGNFKMGVEHHWTGKRVYPATKEQRDALMKAMNDTGYEWNAEKKELKKKK